MSVTQTSNSRLENAARLAGGKLIVPAAVFLFVAGTGVATSLVGNPPAATRSEDTNAFSQAEPAPDGELLAHLADYSHSISAQEPASRATADELLPDVDTMIERLAARLKATPGDVGGWRMLGWSYFNTGRFEDAASAYAKAVELDPSSAELKLAYEEAKAKASESADAAPASSSRAAETGSDDEPSIEKVAVSEAMPARERDAAIRSMVDGLAARLERSPRDVEGWTRLMRSRVVLGEREIATTELRKALEIFKDDPAASDTITAAAIELGLTAQ
jgi:cytochrome c-type biogenesis protein CcmH